MDFTPSDFKKTQLLDPGWYPFKVTNYKPDVSKNSGNPTEVFTFVGISGPAKDLEIVKAFANTDNARFFMLPLYKACGAKIGENGAKGLDPNNCVGKVIDILVKHNEYGGRTSNDPADFRAPQGVTA